MDAKRETYWWWLHNHNTPKMDAKYSPWLTSTLADLEEKAKAMLKLIEEDADSFAQRAEMYYKKRPELINMVEDLYRAYRSLAERYDQQKMDPINRFKSPLRHSLPDFKSEFRLTSADKILKSEFSFIDETNNISSEDCYEDSEVDDPEDENNHDAVVIKDDEYDWFGDHADLNEMVKLRKELERLREEKCEMGRKLEEAENKLTKERGEMLAVKSYLQNVITEKDEEKREVIRQLSLAMEIMSEDNWVLKKSILKDNQNKQGSPAFKIFKGFGIFFGISPNCSTYSVVPL